MLKQERISGYSVIDQSIHKPDYLRWISAWQGHKKTDYSNVFITTVNQGWILNVIGATPWNSYIFYVFSAFRTIVDHRPKEETTCSGNIRCPKPITHHRRQWGSKAARLEGTLTRRQKLQLNLHIWKVLLAAGLCSIYFPGQKCHLLVINSDTRGDLKKSCKDSA